MLNSLRAHRWAWQNTHLTRRIADDQRITIRETITKVSRSGRTRRRPARPRMSLMDKLSNLYLLLRVPSFARWPLEVRFFCEDVYLAWLRYTSKADPALGRGINVIAELGHSSELAEDDTAAAKDGETRALGKSSRTYGIEAIDTNYLTLKDHVEKSLFMLAESEHVNCAVCSQRIKTPEGTTLVCPKPRCRAASHMSCLAQEFLREEGGGNLVPSTGHCPSCRSDLQWVDLVRELSLRMHGKKEVDKLMRKPRKPKSKAAKGKKAISSTYVADSDLDDDEDDDLEDEGLYTVDVLDEPHADKDQKLGSFDDDDMMSVTSWDSETSHASKASHMARPGAPRLNLEIVIEDSDWDNAEVLD